MANPETNERQSQPRPVRPPTLPPDFPDIPQNPGSELQPLPTLLRPQTRLRARLLMRVNPKLLGSHAFPVEILD
jgi:hypothetical protein